ncbi:MAG: hypothetical protein E7018_01825 [Alphaproteobacteria bacterium]|nr:hypothetical protein [Alphaproteobacteria bacterium]
MKVKNFYAPSINEAMLQIKEELGSDVVILSQQQSKEGFQLTVGWDETTDFDFNENEQISSINTKAFFDETILRKALSYHGLVDKIQYHLLSAGREAAKMLTNASPQSILELALSQVFSFTPLLESPERLQMFMGVPGAGKSTAIAKAATQAKLKGQNPAIVSTDNIRAGANIQLKSFAEILDVDFHFFKEPQKLYHFLQTESDKYDRIFIDTPGINPFIATEVEKVASFADTFKGDKILTADAGRNVEEAVEVAEIFNSLGAKMLLPTRLDLTRRIGAILSVAGSLNMQLCAAGVSSSIAKGLAPINAKALSELILS